MIGLDGATWDVIKPLADEGELPTVKKLVEDGVWTEGGVVTKLFNCLIWE